MHLRVVRFTDVDPEQVKAMLGRVAENDGPPEGVTSSGIQMIIDEDQRTAVVIQKFESLEDMQSSEAALDGMDASDTPGTRASVDRGEVALDLNA